MNYGKAIRIVRTVAGLQQKELADLAKVDASLMSLIEKGKRNPSLSTLEKITKQLGVPQHLLTLLAAESEDLKTIRPDELKLAAESLARMLLDHASTRPPKSTRRSRKKAA